MPAIKKRLTLDEYYNGILNGNISILSRAITLIESSSNKDKEIAIKLVEKLLPLSGNSRRIGITGMPGVGKSTFIESIGKYLISKGHKLAVLAIDPSSSKNKGSILGDKTRMEKLAAQKNAFIRPSPTSGALGGVANATRESMILCEAAGFDIIFIETVGVGQSEIDIANMVDFFLLLTMAGAGDELQGIKRGIIEMAQMIVVNKSDGDNIEKSQKTARQYRNALSLFFDNSALEIKVLTVSALYNKGINKVWDYINEYFNLLEKNNIIYEKRKQQSIRWMNEIFWKELKNTLKNNKNFLKLNNLLEKQVANNQISPYSAAKKLIKSIL